VALADLLADLERRAADAERIGASAPVAAVLRDVAAELRNLEHPLATRAPAPSVPDRWLTADDVALRLSVTVRRVYQLARRWPFAHRWGRRTLRVSESGLESWVARQR
jgi:hypothetical protein